MQVEGTTVVGRYELVGVNGSLLPASMKQDEAGAGDPHRGVAYPPGGGPPNRQDCPPSAGTVPWGAGASVRAVIQSETFVQRASRGADGVSPFLSPHRTAARTQQRSV
jgi:hypothetical protein